MKIHLITLFLASFAVEMHFKTPQSMSISKMFEQEDITPNLIPLSPPSELGVKFETASAKLGNNVCPLRTVLPPTISFNAEPGHYYTFIFIDPDLPSRAAPTIRSRLLALYINMVNSDINSGFSLAPYLPPTPGPGSGPHRYIALVYKQSGKIEINSEPLIRSVLPRVRFSVKDFAINNTLGDPIAGNFFLSEMTYNYENQCNMYLQR